VADRGTHVQIFWIEDEFGKTGGGPQPAGWLWPADVPLPIVGDRIRAPQGSSPLDRGAVRVLERTWELGTGMDGRLMIALRLDCEWVGSVGR